MYICVIYIYTYIYTWGLSVPCLASSSRVKSVTPAPLARPTQFALTTTSRQCGRR